MIVECRECKLQIDIFKRVFLACVENVFVFGNIFKIVFCLFRSALAEFVFVFGVSAFVKNAFVFVENVFIFVEKSICIC